ncbi:MAG: hypothetical protein HQL74_08955 [Magnetococcales bacterium]|nr:hypothetical protein [Magnetococcales bacterium]
MSDIEQAQTYLRMAGKDYRALLVFQCHPRPRFKQSGAGMTITTHPKIAAV